MNIIANRFPNGKKYALTMSYDDGTVYDRALFLYLTRME